MIEQCPDEEWVTGLKKWWNMCVSGSCFKHKPAYYALNRSLFKDEAGQVTGAGATEKGQDVDDLKSSTSSNLLSQMQAQMAAHVAKRAAGFNTSSSLWERSSPISSTAHQPPRPSAPVPSHLELHASWQRPSTPPRASTSRPPVVSPAESELTPPEDGSQDLITSPSRTNAKKTGSKGKGCQVVVSADEDERSPVRPSSHKLSVTNGPSFTRSKTKHQRSPRKARK